MPCVQPLKAWRSKKVNSDTGKRSLAFTHSAATYGEPMLIPCGKCFVCRQRRARDFAVRIIHESMLYNDNCYITLTYDDENLPPANTLRLSDFQNFMKRLRKYILPQKLRFFHCGEYGDKKCRPHYHAILFGYDFFDKEEAVVDNKKMFVSETLNKIWGKGICTCDEVNYSVASYVSQYVIKKLVVGDVKEYYGVRKPEYVTLSRGLGKDFFLKYVNDFYPCDEVVIEGKVIGKPPKYYDSLLDNEVDCHLMARVKKQRRKYGVKCDLNGTNRLVEIGFAKFKEHERFTKQRRGL